MHKDEFKISSLDKTDMKLKNKVFLSFLVFVL